MKSFLNLLKNILKTLFKSKGFLKACAPLILCSGASIAVGIENNLNILIYPAIALLVIALFGLIVGIVFIKASSNEKKLKKRISNTVMLNEGADIAKLTFELKKPEAEIRRLIYQCIQDNLLPGYTLMGNRIVNIDVALSNLNESKNPKVQQEYKNVALDCIGCGANFIAPENQKECPYCGRINV